MTRKRTCRGKDCTCQALPRSNFCARCSLQTAKKETQERLAEFHRARWVIAHYADGMNALQTLRREVEYHLTEEGVEVNVSLKEIDEAILDA